MNKKSNSGSRRRFIKNSVLSSAIIGASSGLTFGSEAEPTEKFKIGGYDYPRMGSLIDGSENLGGNPYSYSKQGISDLNTAAFEGQNTFDITEIGLGPYILAFGNNGFRSYQLLPIFPLRLFRHKSIFIKSRGKIKTPQDLKGARIGTPGYSSTSLTWIRGILKDEYGVNPNEIKRARVYSSGDATVRWGVAGHAGAIEFIMKD